MSLMLRRKLEKLTAKKFLSLMVEEHRRGGWTLQDFISDLFDSGFLDNVRENTTSRQQVQEHLEDSLLPSLINKGLAMKRGAFYFTQPDGTALFNVVTLNAKIILRWIEQCKNPPTEDEVLGHFYPVTISLSRKEFDQCISELIDSLFEDGILTESRGKLYLNDDSNNNCTSVNQEDQDPPLETYQVVAIDFLLCKNHHPRYYCPLKMTLGGNMDIELAYNNEKLGIRKPVIEPVMDDNRCHHKWGLTVQVARFKEDLASTKRELKEEAGVSLQAKRVSFYDYFHVSPMKIHLNFSLQAGSMSDAPQAHILGVFLHSEGVVLTDVQDVVFKSTYDPTTHTTTTDVPKPSTEALQYLEELVPEEDFRYVMFDDKLVTVSNTGKELGELTVNIEATHYKGLKCFLIHANNHGSVDGVPCGTSIVCYVSKCLETLEQQHHEYVKDVQKTTKIIPLDHMRGSIFEAGSSLLLHGLLIEKPIDDVLQFISFDSEANLCPAVYRRLHERLQTVGDVELRVMGIERTINWATDLPITWQSYFLHDGHLTSEVQIDSPVTMKWAKVPVQIEREEEVPKHVFEKKVLLWEEDLQLHSRFLSRKEKIKSDHATYMRHHPELRALLSDFQQFPLLRKPEDVIAFAADYFSAFSTSVPDVPPYLASNAPTPIPCQSHQPSD